MNVVMFMVNSKYLVGGANKDVQVWQVADGKQVVTMPVECQIICVATSRDGRWFAVGLATDKVLVWDMKTYKQVFVNKNSFIKPDFNVFIKDIDFSPDLSHLISTDGGLNTATIWDIPVWHSILLYLACWKVWKLNHDEPHTAKYSPQGD